MTPTHVLQRCSAKNEDTAVRSPQNLFSAADMLGDDAGLNPNSDNGGRRGNEGRDGALVGEAGGMSGVLHAERG